MRYRKNHKVATRQRIIESASRLFAANGYAATSIEVVMRECGLTRGGFYAHFASKAQLYRHAIDFASAGRGLLKDREDGVDECDWIDSLLNDCFSDGDARSNGSRRAFLAMDLAAEESEVRCAYTRAFKTISEELLQRTAAHVSCTEDSILSLTAMMVGAVAVAQTTDDIALRTKLLTACRENAKSLLESELQRRPLNFFWAPTMNG